ncbi:MAG: hypothetical protein J7604_16740 [Sporocytophaga sp.]|uniref:hypothetical protein n=1 Tax=Sporocytophaga sp. TaxID=2231183 RepID=UPI001AFD1169|nr:hypothetical protein [Sporocytophaga sp.]MBO9701857.1 hypothetical protein [Sporocytophaga sp.]
MGKINSICFLIITISIIACKTETESKKAKQQRQSETINKVDQQINKITSDTTVDLRDRVFEFASTTYLDGCTFEFGCDCCLGEFLFKSDYTFYYVDHCEGDITVTRGIYQLKNNFIYLNSDSIRVEELYNWDYENDTTAIEYILNDSIITPYKMQFAINKCESKIKLVDIEDPTTVALNSGKNLDSILTALKKKGIIKRFTK